jgi:hypothetical protein
MCCVPSLPSAPMSHHRRADDRRRLVDMNAAEPQRLWAPDLPPVGPPLEQEFPLSENASYVQRLSFDERGRLVHWVVVQRRRCDGEWRRVAVYDTSHEKGVHVHLYDRREREFTERHLRSLGCYRDLTESLDDVIKGLVACWQENERRSDRGK